MTVGKASPQHLLQHGTSSVFDLIARFGILYASLQESPAGALYRTGAYGVLDPSEKGAYSYFLGLTATKLIAGRYLDVPWLQHLDVYWGSLQPTFVGGVAPHKPVGSRPDLVGLDTSGRWVVMEAKGRSNALPNSVLPSAKTQVGKVVSIGGKPPHLGVAVATSFKKGAFRVDWADPEPDEAGVELAITVDQFASAYYAPLQDVLGADGEVVEAGGVAYRVRRVESADALVGVDQRVVDDPVAGVYGQLAKTEGTPLSDEGRELEADGLKAPLGPVSSAYAGPDGVMVALGPSWSTPVMALDPRERGAVVRG